MSLLPSYLNPPDTVELHEAIPTLFLLPIAHSHILTFALHKHPTVLQPIAHRDLKPANLMFSGNLHADVCQLIMDSGIIKIGVSRVVLLVHMSTYAYTHAFACV